MSFQEHDPETGEIQDSVILRDKPRMAFSDYARKLSRKFQNLLGQELPDPVPMQPPVGFIQQPSMMDHVMDLIQSNNLRQAALAAGLETLEESDDFEVDDDDEPYSAYQMPDDYEPLSVFLERAKPYVEAAAQEAAEASAKMRAAKPPLQDSEPSPEPLPGV